MLIYPPLFSFIKFRPTLLFAILPVVLRYVRDLSAAFFLTESKHARNLYNTTTTPNNANDLDEESNHLQLFMANTVKVPSVVKLATIPKWCWISLRRLLDELCQQNEAKKINKYISYVIYDYVHYLSHYQIDEEIRNIIQMMIFTCMDVCDQHELTYVHRLSDISSQHVFKSIHSQFLKQYKFTGQV
jgi:hypothetical protein